MLNSAMNAANKDRRVCTGGKVKFENDGAGNLIVTYTLFFRSDLALSEQDMMDSTSECLGFAL
jgi:hypothetical protein